MQAFESKLYVAEKAAERQINELNDSKSFSEQQLAELQEKLRAAENALAEKDTQLNNMQTKLLDSEAAAIEVAQTLQNQIQAAHDEMERTQSQIDELKQKHETELAELGHTLGEKISSLTEQLKNEKAALQTQMLKLNSQNQEYRSMLLQNASKIRHLLSRLPVVERDERLFVEE